MFGWARNIFNKFVANDAVSSFLLRDIHGQGPFTSSYAKFVPRKIDADFMEFLRESVPVIDGAINRLVSLDGTLEVGGDNELLVEEIKDFFYNVRVNDMQSGIPAFLQNLSAEAHEQGFAIGEFVLNKKRNDIVSLRVADSKSIKFSLTATGLSIVQKVAGDTKDRVLNPDTLMYFGINNENQNPYGVPMARGCEFVSQIYHTIQTAIKNNWERFGDPSYSIIYKTSKRDGTDLEKRRKTIADDFENAITAKRAGKSADFIRAIDLNSDIQIKIIGADGQILEMEVPMRHILEQIVAKTGLPPWMLGFHWSTTESLSNAEAEMVLADVETRRAAKSPIVYNLVRTLLAVRGRTWKKDDWWLKWVGANLRDVVAQAQARFLNAQADMYYMTNAAEAGIELDVNSLALNKQAKQGSKNYIVVKELGRPKTWPDLDKLEDEFVNELQTKWDDFFEQVKNILKIETVKTIKEVDALLFTTEQRALIMSALNSWIGSWKWDNKDSPLSLYYGKSYSLGLIRAAAEYGKETPVLDIIKNKEILDKLTKEGFSLVKDNATKAIVNKILPEMEGFVIAGSNPVEAGRRLEALFGAQNSNWERLARSDMSMCAERAKGEEWEAWGVKEMYFSPAPDACPICIALKGKYPIKECPLPVRDTHPFCRCARSL